MSESVDQLHGRIHELEARLAELEDQNLRYEREIARRGVKLSCANIALSRAKIAFDEQVRLREEAIQDIAHDLRTPLTSIKGAAQNILDGIAGPVEPSVMSYVEIIGAQSKRLMGVVNWLLQAIRITSEQRTLDAAPADLGALVGRVARGLQPIAEERGISLEVRASPMQICLDGGKLELALENIIGNALKFTDAGGAVSVTLDETDDGARITVADTGIGMSQEALERIFHRYYRADPDREGSGLGLLIARELVRLHGGDIEVASEYKKGSTFTIVLPRVERDPAAAPAAQAG